MKYSNYIEDVLQFIWLTW